jgi:hypothetical protein
MGVDRTGTGTDDPGEAAEQPPPPDRRPPPDRPGAEGAPSRADSRNGAAAANDTSDQAAENQSEDKPDTAQSSQETSGEQGFMAVEDRPETPGMSEVNERESPTKDDGVADVGYETGHGEADTGGRPEAQQPSGETGNPSHAGEQERPLDGRATRRDSTSTPETDEQPMPVVATEQRHDRGAGEIPSTDGSESASVHTASSQDTADTGAGPPLQGEDVVPVTMYREDGPTTDRREEMSEATESLEDADHPQSDEQTVPERSTEPGDEANPDVQPGMGAGDLAEGANRRTYEFSVSGIPVRMHIDQAGAAAAESKIPIKDTEPEPIGDRIVKSIEDDKMSPEDRLLDRFRKKEFEIADNASDLIDEASKTVQDFLAKRPAGHPLIRSSPELSSAPPEGIEAGSLAAGVMATGILFGKLGHWVYRGAKRSKEK